MATNSKTTININGEEINIDDIAMVEVDNSLINMFDTIIDAIAYRTAFAIDQQEDAETIAKLAVANHFVRYSQERVKEEAGEQPTPGARSMLS